MLFIAQPRNRRYIMNTKKVYKIEILENGIIQLLVQTVYFKTNGEELTRENWRTTLLPGDFDRAKELLDDYHYNIINSVWTSEVVTAYARLKSEVI